VAEALALWRGPALADAGDFAGPFARRLEELRLDATVTFLTRELDAGRAAARIGELEALVTEHPLHEKLTGLLMRALAATGRQADASPHTRRCGPGSPTSSASIRDPKCGPSTWKCCAAR
jgi:DNA-binding SARP family transcriptional activator